ncbi:winged helix-turn-helix transcriptional regulator [Metallosphaera tengchongensis]|uniref:Winged helix-turn-helix transcriptional regulator n=1 Tax=Metallosphaera tengchongensis TaxID=1532350 RepID=A0A6N0NWM7_9CREN|nr:winged helix-turn-helix transcriptional regulator [Metallosphaera tengchongensis]QKR00605.1 winged helix-turn-helix transcriptional regulator [Metallosphaera tengchongensis]
MDDVNKKIVLYLMKDYRYSQRKIAKELNISPPAVNYRVERMTKEGIIKKVSLYVNPNFYGKYHGYASFSNRKEWKGEYVFKVKCIEDVNVYEIEGDTLEDIKGKINEMSSALGEPRMVYIPEQHPYSPSSFDLRLLSVLKENPVMTPVEISERMKVSSKTVRRHLRYLYKKEFIRLVPIVDINKSNVVMYAVFTKNVEVAKKFFENVNFREISDKNGGIFVNIGNSIQEVSDKVKKFREYDPDADLMIAESYDVA